MKIDLYLMNYKGYFVLLNIIKEGYKDFINAVICSKDSNVINDYYSEIKQACTNNSIIFYNRNETPNEVVDYKIAIGWRWLINDYSNLLVIHDSLLPKYRGFSPVVSALINGENKIGATLIYASKEYDRGDIILQKELEITYPIKIQKAIESISNIYWEIIKDFFQIIKSGSSIKAQPQDEGLASYSLWRDDEDYRIDWDKESSIIKRLVDSVGFPFKGASCMLDGKLIRILDCTEIEDIKIENRTSGKIFKLIDKKPVVVCGRGLLFINHAVNDIGEELEILSMKNRFY